LTSVRSQSVDARRSETYHYDDLHPFGYLGGTFSEDEVEHALADHRPLTMDFSIPGKCLNRCSYCGYYEVNSEGKLSQSEILDVISQFAVLGGKSIKILGEGEPLLRSDICEILSAIRDHGLTPVLFTCGDVLANERLCVSIHGTSCQHLNQRLFEIGCTIVLKFESWQQDTIVGRSGYSDLRNKALRTLLNLGFNRFYPTRLGFGTVLLKENFCHIKDVYKYALENNIYPLICPLMPIGRSKSKAWRDKLAPTLAETRTLKQELTAIRDKQCSVTYMESDFPGGRPCDIARCGFYVDDAGAVFICESDLQVGNVRVACLEELWKSVDVAKDARYGCRRRTGLCMPKRRVGIV
jgi:MoaA/NifB/PqqE/SkfB family radical SAM enzyme